MIKQILHLGKKITKDESIFVQFFSFLNCLELFLCEL